MSFDPNSNAILQDPEYLLKNPGYIKQAHDLLVQYGIVPGAGAGFGGDAATQQEADLNPYSIAAMLRKGYASNLGANATGAVSHGALYSGAYQNSNLHSLDSYQQGISGAGTELQGKLSGVQGARTDTLASIWNRLSTANQNVTPDQNAYAPGREADRPVDTTGQGYNPWHINAASGGVKSMLKAPKAGVFGGRGHIT